MKKRISLFLCIALLAGIFTALPSFAAASTPSQKGKCGKNVYYEFNQYGTELKIYGKGAMYNYKKAVDSPFYRCAYRMQSIEIGEGVTTIGSNCLNFSHECQRLKLPTTIKRIEKDAVNGGILFNCYFAGSVNQWCAIIFGNENSNPISGVSFFYIGGEKVTSLTIPGSVGDVMPFAFYRYKGLTSVSFENGVKAVRYKAFYECTALKELDLGNSVTAIGKETFFHTSLTRLLIPSSVQFIGARAFGKGKFTRIAVDSANLVYNSAGDCNAVIETATATLLFGCINTVIPENIKIIGNYAFAFMRLTELTIPDSVVAVGESAFYHCTYLERVHIGDGVKTIGNKAFYMNTALKELSMGKQVQAIGNSAFCAAPKLKALAFPDSLQYIGELAFAACRGLESVVLPINTEKIGKNAFFACELHDVYIPRGVKGIGKDAFTGKYLTIHGAKNTLAERYAIIHHYPLAPFGHKHTYVNGVTPATFAAAGETYRKCRDCGSVNPATVQSVARVTDVRLAEYTIAYDGKVHTPKVEVKDANGQELTYGKDYSLVYQRGRTVVGQYGVKVTLKGRYSGERVVRFSVVPPTPQITALKKTQNGIRLYWKKQTAQTDGFVLYYGRTNYYTKAQKVIVNGIGKNYVDLKPIDGADTYYFVLYAYKRMNNHNFLSNRCSVLNLSAQ